MKYIIIGAGFTGLISALDLVKAGHEVKILEKNDYIGGLAAGFKDMNWQWSLEHHYHHIFKSDREIIQLARELNVRVTFRKVKSSFWDGEGLFQFDSLGSVLFNQKIGMVGKLRTLGTIAFLKAVPNLDLFETITCEKLIRMTMGKNVWQQIWLPLFRGKFHERYKDVNATWFWARIHARSQALGYFEGGFSALLGACEKKLKKLGAEIHLGTEVKAIKNESKAVVVTTNQGEYKAARVLICGPRAGVRSLLPELKLTGKSVPGLGAVTMILALKKQLLADGTYWLNISDRTMPFLAMVEHTNMVDRQMYGEDHLVYLGNYLPREHDFFEKSDKELVKIYSPYLKKINNRFEEKWIRKSWVFKAGYAQSIFGINHKDNLPEIEIVKGKIYWCGMEHVYPWDRGTNYAVRWGHDVAKLMMSR